MFLLAVKSRIVAAAMIELGMESVDGKPTKNVFERSSEISNCNFPRKVQYLRRLAKLIVDKYIMNTSDANTIIDKVMNEDEQKSLASIPQLPNGRFPCRFEGCEKSFRYVSY
jgi:hypothetical protein